MEKEALTLEALAIAMAAHNSGGIVIVQVERVAERGSLNPRQVRRFPASWSIAWSSPRSPNITCRLSPRPTAWLRRRDPIPMSSIRRWRWMAHKDHRPSRRLELMAQRVVNLGIGMPEGVSSVAAEER